MYFINKANNLTNKIKFSVFEYNKMIKGLSSEIDRLEENNDYYHKGYIELHDRIEEAINYLERDDLDIRDEWLKDIIIEILKGEDKEVRW